MGGLPGLRASVTITEKTDFATIFIPRLVHRDDGGGLRRTDDAPKGSCRDLVNFSVSTMFIGADTRATAPTTLDDRDGTRNVFLGSPHLRDGPGGEWVPWFPPEGLVSVASRVSGSRSWVFLDYLWDPVGGALTVEVMGNGTDTFISVFFVTFTAGNETVWAPVVVNVCRVLPV